MFIIEALHPDGWRPQGRFRFEYWAWLEARTRCCSGGRNYRIVDEEAHQVVALLDTGSCRLSAVPPRSPAPAG
ncbi:MAG: hypothetical protein ACKO0M_15005 [Cyanobium sp.]